MEAHSNFRAELTTNFVKKNGEHSWLVVSELVAEFREQDMILIMNNECYDKIKLCYLQMQ